MSPIPDLPPIREDATLDATAYVAALLAMAEAAQKAADAQAKVTAGIKAMQEAMDAAAAGATEAATAETKLAEASAGAAGAENSAAAAAGNLARANADAGRASLTAQRYLIALIAQQGRALTVATSLARATDQVKDALEAVAFAEQIVDAETAKLTQAWFEGAQMARLEAQQAEVLAEAEANTAATFKVATDAIASQARALAILTAMEKAAAEQAGGLAKGAAAIAAALAAVSITRGVGALGTMVHWIIAGGAELAAVLIPALIALGSGMAVAAQGAQNVYTHMSALYTATEATANMFHTTLGQALGLGGALQKMQNAANPVVYSILGGAVLALHGSFSGLAAAGLQVLRVFQDFSAKVVADFQSGGMGGQLHALLAGMVTDLTQFAQIIGNIGHAILNFASAMPGLAHVLLSVADAISQVILWVSQLPHWLITTVMVFEEAWRWGGLLASIVLRLAGAFGALGTLGLPAVVGILTQFGTMIQSAALGAGLFLANIGRLIGGLGRVIPAAEGAGAAVSKFGGAIFDAVAAIPAWQLGLGVVAAAGLAFLIYRLSTAKTAIQQMTDAMQAQVDHARGMMVFGDIAANLARLNGAQDALIQSAGGAQNAIHNVGAAVGRYGASAVQAVSPLDQLHAGMTQQQQDMVNAAQAVTYLTRAYGVSWTGALALGTQAGVRWDAGIGRMSASAVENLIKVEQLIRGYQLMGQSAGAVGQDMTAIGIESALQATKISQLTQAWQSYMGQLTGGTTGLATFEQGLQNIGTVASSTAGTLFQSTGRMNESTARFAASLQGFTGKAAQNWQNFNQVVTTGAQQFITWMQTAGAMGVVSGAQMSGAVKGIVAQLIPFAARSEAARAELAGLAAQTGAVVPPTTRALAAWAKGGDSAQQLARFVQGATGRMSDMAKVASNLGAVMQNDLVAMFDKARIAASNLPGALNTLSSSIRATGTNSATTQGALLQVIEKLQGLRQPLPTVTALLNSMGYQLTQAQVKAIEAADGLSRTGGSASRASGQMHGATGAAYALGQALASLHSVNLTVTTSYINEGAPGLGGTGYKMVPGHAAGGVVDAADTGRDSVLVPMRGGEGVLTPGGLQRLGGPASLARLNSGQDAASAPQVIHLDITVPVRATVDESVLFEVTKRVTAVYNLRTNGNPSAGVLAPRTH